ncbi:hypothetical protein E1262_28420 [Jiangella aurantiaca]|uniref:Transcriptional repressor n=2 Tax=Jiangella aurantiaca TaxID=2530373 RepID=A0A4R5A0F1_9ACTN|nr:hypothetical protein E1262_28420 [Jiangella aurantiaca]
MVEAVTEGAGLRRTRQRAAVLGMLSDCADFISAQDLHDRMAAADVSVSLSTVYRAGRPLAGPGPPAAGSTLRPSRVRCGAPIW